MRVGGGVGTVFAKLLCLLLEGGIPVSYKTQIYLTVLTHKAGLGLG